MIMMPPPRPPSAPGGCLRRTSRWSSPPPTAAPAPAHSALGCSVKESIPLKICSLSMKTKPSTKSARAGRVGLAGALIFLSAVGAGLAHAGRPEDEELESMQRHLAGPGRQGEHDHGGGEDRHHPHGRVLAGLAVRLGPRPESLARRRADPDLGGADAGGAVVRLRVTYEAMPVRSVVSFIMVARISAAWSSAASSVSAACSPARRTSSATSCCASANELDAWLRASRVISAAR